MFKLQRQRHEVCEKGIKMMKNEYFRKCFFSRMLFIFLQCHERGKKSQTVADNQQSIYLLK